MIIVHGPDVGSSALLGGKVAVGIETPARSNEIDATIPHGHVTSPLCLFWRRIIGDNYFNRLHALGAKTGKAALQ
ncbi:MAG: hypothetical protein QOI53_3918 [Verrucomicrobiota bacterium]|jgi:hypothetical protein|nr:hypothetical protein [Verrucomicrobiota bacterium]